MDSLATLDYPAMGFSIRYDYGLFKQKIVENQQVELADDWLETGEVFLMPRSDKTFKVCLGGKIEQEYVDGKFKFYHKNANVINATAYDLMIPGYDSKAVSTLRLWRASPAVDIDMRHFSQGDYMAALRAKTEAEVISKVLYPADEHDSGKQLRVSQQYMLVSASLQSIIKDHLKNFGTLDNLTEKAAVHLNDTHPALAIPELMRLLMDEYNYSWDAAWSMVTTACAYTNHTVLVEALESWDENLIRFLLPRIYMIIKEIDRRFVEETNQKVGEYIADHQRVDRMRIINGGRVKMANLSVIGCHSVNGVSQLHGDIIKRTVFNDFYTLTPNKLRAVTNGIVYRRWLNQSNPLLTEFITSLIGEGFKKDASELEKLMQFAGDKTVLNKLDDIKTQNKVALRDYLIATSGQKLNADSRFDVQVKRLHEYKRQLLNVLKIIHEYLNILDNPTKSVTPQTFIFGAKAAGGYYHAKRIIQLINCLGAEIAKNNAVSHKLAVVFVENYNVSKAERIFPASEVSQQISLAGKEASGTGNMKFMLNGAVTFGTIDGANVEIGEAVGEDNIFNFGLKTEEVEALWRQGYISANYYLASDKIKRVIAIGMTPGNVINRIFCNRPAPSTVAAS